MRFEDVPFEELEEVSDPARWGAGGSRDRRLYRNSSHYFKVWGPSYLSETCAAIGDEFVIVPNLSDLHGNVVGLFSPLIASAVEDYIYDDSLVLRGYVARCGAEVDDIPCEFADSVFNEGIRCGWFFSDLKPGNVVSVNGRFSLIDLDTHLSNVEKLNLAFEQQFGCLREHLDGRYTDMIYRYVENRN